jgi:hypothetical protein
MRKDPFSENETWPNGIISRNSYITTSQEKALGHFEPQSSRISSYYNILQNSMPPLINQIFLANTLDFKAVHFLTGQCISYQGLYIKARLYDYK